MNLQKCKSAKDWDNLVKSSSQGNFFCTYSFLSLTKNTNNLYFIKDGEKILAGVIINEIKKLQQNIPFFYQGIILNDQLLSKKNHKFSKQYFEISSFLIEKITDIYDNFSLSLDPSLNDVRPFQWFRYKDESKKKIVIQIKYTGILDLSKFNNYEDYLQSIRAVRRQEYKKIKENFILEEEADIKNLDLLHEKTFKRQNLNRGENEKIVITKVISNLIKKKIGKLLVYKNKATSDVVAASYFLTDNINAYNISLASDPMQRKLSPGTGLILKQIELCFKNKIKYVDFVGINSPNRGDYKLSFNPETKIYFNLKY